MSDSDENQRLTEAYAARGYKRVLGWLYPGGVALVRAIDGAQKALGVEGHVGEIGVYHGKLFILLYLLRRPEERAVAVDLFRDSSTRAPFKADFVRNLERHAGESAALSALETDSMAISAEAVTEAAGGRLRLLSVDAGHSAEAVEHDLAIARDALGEGGVIVFDDYFNESLPAVSEGAIRFFLKQETGSLVPFAIGGNKILFCAEAFAERYYRALEAAPFKASKSEMVFLGRRVLHLDFRTVRLFGFIGVSPVLAETRFWRWLRERPLGRFVRLRLLKG